jgi:maltose O-acetyltransferase
MKYLFQKITNRFIYRPFLKIKLKKVGANFRIGYCSEIKNPSYFSFGDNFYSGPFSYFGTNKNNPVFIGDYVMFGPRCIIQGGNHDIEYEGFMYNNKNIDHMSSELVIENGVWIGSNTTLINGTDIGEGSIIGAMSLVNKKIPPYVVAGGIPIRVIKPRFKSLEQLQSTLTKTNSKYNLDSIIKMHKELGFHYD